MSVSASLMTSQARNGQQTRSKLLQLRTRLLARVEADHDRIRLLLDADLGGCPKPPRSASSSSQPASGFNVQAIGNPARCPIG
jgi:hypothetical protein